MDFRRFLESSPSYIQKSVSLGSPVSTIFLSAAIRGTIGALCYKCLSHLWGSYSSFPPIPGKDTIARQQRWNWQQLPQDLKFRFENRWKNRAQSTVRWGD